ncbi:MAG: M14 family metallopeptidase, partial [Acidobacteriota bacterium]|nr:M14 family metallopeptidase [Acidobacteriota bacterium]
AARVPAPEDVLGFRPGDDRKLAAWSEIVEYFRRLDAASDRVKFEELGRTTLGAPFVLATISAPENLARLDEFKEIQRQLADPRRLGPDADRAAARLIARGKTIVLVTCGVHSTEVGSTLSSALIAHRLASSDEPEVQKILREVIVLLVPSLNPDGVDIVKRWYDRTLGTPYEGTSPPELYHKYVGHDNNRDWYAFTQVETRLTVARVHNEWHPQIVHDIHQQGTHGSRLFLPPYMQPVEPNVPRQLVEGYTELGLAVAKRMLAAGFKGITWDSTYDAWTPARAYSHYHGGVRILSETASARLATPINLKFEELRSREGYDPQKPSANFPEPWRGGPWRLRDITNYMTTAAFELLKHAAENREHWLRRFYEVGREAVRPRRAGELLGFKIKRGRNTDTLEEILERGGVETSPVAVRPRPGAPPAPGPDVYVPLAQPYGAFAKALLERQTYPNLRDAAGNPVPPYDVTAHTLPLLLGVEVEPVYRPPRTTGRVRTGSVTTPPAPGPTATRPAQRPARLGLYKSHVPSMDEGWTRWVLEQNGVGYVSLDDARARAGDLRRDFDAIVIPDQSPRAILEGHHRGTMPEEFTGGLGEEGVRALREFVERGGTLVCLNDASNFAIEQLKLPVRDVTEGLKRTEFFVPGSILRTVLDTTHLVARGMPRESVAWFEDSPAFEIKGDPPALARVKVIARYPHSGGALLSGWLLGEQHLRGRAALVEVGLGAGRVYLFGFRPQYRAQSHATYPLLFNAINAK